MNGTPERNLKESGCTVCGDSLSDGRPNYRVVLEVEDRTRSTKQFMGNETNLKRLYLDRELCEQCWQAYYDRLSRESDTVGP